MSDFKGLRWGLVAACYLTPLRLSCTLTGRAARMYGGLELLQDRAALLLVRGAPCGVQGLHWMGAGTQQVNGPSYWTQACGQYSRVLLVY